MPLRAAIVGCGRAGRLLHIRALNAVDGVRVSAVVDPDPERRRSAAAAVTGPAAPHADHRSLLDEDDVDLVAVCTPPSERPRIVIDALAAGKHVYVEKPISLRIEEASAMVEAAKATPARVTMGFNLRSHRLVRRARDVVHSGRLGAIRLVRSVWTAGHHVGGPEAEWRFDPSRGGGALFELATHHFDLWRYLLGEDLTAVQAVESSDHRSASVSARSRSGIPCSAAFSLESADTQAWEILGRDETLAFSCYAADSLRLESARKPAGGLGRRIRALGHAVRGGPELLRAARTGGDYVDSYRRHWETFLAAVRGEQEPICTLEDGREALKLVLAARESFRTGEENALERAAPEGEG